MKKLVKIMYRKINLIKMLVLYVIIIKIIVLLYDQIIFHCSILIYIFILFYQ